MYKKFNFSNEIEFLQVFCQQLLVGHVRDKRRQQEAEWFAETQENMNASYVECKVAQVTFVSIAYLQHTYLIPGATSCIKKKTSPITLSNRNLQTNVSF